ncbi:hypothetical protein RBH26_03440 [Natronolimnohabitans sp. A-GB9]|uniref:hypothetical protein n=1 Tax=Natronolimnohabitans sp. A-GB9 TaxID=3069757 RepID=UPI0027B47CEA|nr:hypothetical protein [Natronolimnohabitans sp. A-GB9]MDQ2049530.1 hypothetical protein [Natronolimnohabitans sp. A-GB9]
MNLDELRSVQSKERQKDSLQNLRPSFYQEVGDYIADLEDERDRAAERAEDPFSSPEVSRLTDEIETAKDVVEAIYERRMGKLVKQASLAAAGMAADDEGLTAEEADLFEDLVDRIDTNKSRVLDVLEGAEPESQPAADAGTESMAEPGPDPESGLGTPDDVAGPETSDSSPPVHETGPRADDPRSDQLDDGSEPEDDPPVPPQEPPADVDPAAAGDGAGADHDRHDESGVTPADVMGGSGPEIGADESVAPTPPEPDTSVPETAAAEPNSESAAENDTDDVDRVTVRITRDVGSILGVDDREYDLSTDDIVTLPEQNATPLLEQEAAEPLE